jgi:Fe-S-cluster containining protein
MCCKAIVYCKPKTELDPFDISEFFILRNWKRLSRVEAIKINPRLAKIDYKVYFYHCKFIDGNMCTIHDARPPICSDYPSGMKISRQMSYSKDCGYFKK